MRFVLQPGNTSIGIERATQGVMVYGTPIKVSRLALILNILTRIKALIHEKVNSLELYSKSLIL